MLHRLNWIINSNQLLALFRQKLILRSNRHKRLKKKNNEDFFIQSLNDWIHFASNNFRTPTSIEEILDQSIFLTISTKLDFSSDNSYYIYKYKALQWKLQNLIGSSKQSYYKRVSGKLSSVSTSYECYWSLLKNVKWQESSCNSTSVS